MRITSIRPAPLAIVFAITYAVFGLGAFIVYAVSSLQAFILPIGIILGIFHLNLNIQLARSPDLLANAFLCVGAVVCYALTGWITGIAFTLCFNFAAQKMGGIDASFVGVAEDESVVKRQMT